MCGYVFVCARRKDGHPFTTLRLMHNQRACIAWLPQVPAPASRTKSVLRIHGFAVHVLTLFLLPQNGWTPLHYAAYGGFAKGVYILLAAGADPLLLDEERKSASDRAAQNRHGSIVAIIKKHLDGPQAKRVRALRRSVGVSAPHL